MRRLRNRYRLVILKETDFQEKASFSIKGFNVFAFLSVIFILMFFVFYLLFGFTPLYNFLPGNKASLNEKKAVRLAYKVDSLSRVVKTRERYLENIKEILTGNVKDSPRIKKRPKKELEVKSEKVDLDTNTVSDSIFQEKMKSRDPYKLNFESLRNEKNTLNNYAFFPPLKGIITSSYDESKGHYAVDVVGPKDIGIKAVLNGTVIYSGWSVSTGYIIMVQHPDNLISVYKHNSELLKKVGNFVEAGEVIAIIGESGALSTGPHLHFELWHNGDPVNPEKYIAF